MGGAETSASALDEARRAVAGRSWPRAHELYASIAVKSALVPTISSGSPPRTDRRRLGAITTREAAHELYLSAGAAAAVLRLTLQQHTLHAAGLGRGAWLRRRALLEDWTRPGLRLPRDARRRCSHAGRRR
jgi:hypothetical protein